MTVSVGTGPLNLTVMSVHSTSLSWPSFHICLFPVLYSTLFLFHMTNTTLLKQELQTETKLVLTKKVILHFSRMLKGVFSILPPHGSCIYKTHLVLMLIWIKNGSMFTPRTITKLRNRFYNCSKLKRNSMDSIFTLTESFSVPVQMQKM